MSTKSKFDLYMLKDKLRGYCDMNCHHAYSGTCPMPFGHPRKGETTDEDCKAWEPSIRFDRLLYDDIKYQVEEREKDLREFRAKRDLTDMDKKEIAKVFAQAKKALFLKGIRSYEYKFIDSDGWVICATISFDQF